MCRRAVLNVIRAEKDVVVSNRPLNPFTPGDLNKFRPDLRYLLDNSVAGGYFGQYKMMQKT